MFKEKTTLIQNMAFMGAVAAINVICSVIGTFFPIASIFIMIFLPFFSTIVSLLCKWKYYPIYFFASIGVALGATFWNLQYTIFYLTPSLITGFMFGFCFKKHLSGSYAILFASIAQLAISYALIPLINTIYSVDMIKQFLQILQLDKKETASIMVPSFIYLLSLVQMVFTYIVLNNELIKFKKDNWSTNNKYLNYGGGILSILVIPFVFFALHVAYLFMFITLFISITIFIDLILNNKNKTCLIIISSICMASGFLSIFIFYNLVKMPYALTLINVSNISIFIIALVYNLKREKELC